MTATTPRTAQIANPAARQTAQAMLQTVSALGLALLVTLATLGSMNHLAYEQHAATVLACSAALQQAQALPATAARS